MLNPATENLIFDLGGVLLDLHHDRCYAAFAALGGITVEEVKSKIAKAACFNLHEKGLISDAQFRDELRMMLKKEHTDADLDNAWNAILGDIPSERLELVQNLRGKYRVFLLSNTNSIHVPHFGEIVRANTQSPSLESFFEKTYYSHLLKMRKPDEEIFWHVLRENKLTPQRTLFLDDYLVNLEGAQKTGLQTFHVQGPKSVFDLFS